MNYQQTIDYLFERLPMFSRIGAAAYKADLVNTLRLCEAIGNPQKKFKSIHVGGTNGKGSVSHMLAAIFQSSGYKTGLYTSPHLKDFRERIKLNGEWIAEQYIIDFVQRLLPLIEQIQPSFFELSVALAFDYFAYQEVDIAIIEVGLGGRLDSTNIITPEMSVITNISFDHMLILGNTLEEIAWEKAGIIKQGVPVVIGEYSRETSGVFEQKAAEQNALLYFADKKRFVADWKFDKTELVAEVTTTHDNNKNYYHLDLPGIYQIKNLITVLEAAQVMKHYGWKIDEIGLSKALRQVKKLTGLHGRWEVIQQNPTIVLDVAHNPAGIRQLSEQIEITDHEALHIVIGLVMDKDAEAILSFLPKHANYYFTKAQIPRALPELELSEIAAANGLHGNYYPDVNSALQFAKQAAGQKDLIVVCGSVFVVGAVNEH